MIVHFDKQIMCRFADSLKKGEPLDPGGEWNREKVLAAMAMLYFEAERHFDRMERPIGGDSMPPETRKAMHANRAWAQLRQAMNRLRDLFKAAGDDWDKMNDVIQFAVDDNPTVIVID